MWGFSQIDSTPGECGAVELDFLWASFPPGENGADECDYIRPAPLAGSSVCARMVTGSLLFGSPHRLVRSCLYSAVLSLQWIDDLVISRESTGIPQNHHLGTVVSRITPDICISVWNIFDSTEREAEFRENCANLLLLLQSLRGTSYSVR